MSMSLEVGQEPNDMPAEQYVLGAMLMGSERAIYETTTILNSSDFYTPTHQQLFALIQDMWMRGLPIELAAVAGEAFENKIFRTHSEATLSLFDLMQSASTSTNAGWYANRVLSKAKLRVISRVALRSYQAAMNPAAEADDTIANIVEDITSAAVQHLDTELSTASEAMSDAITYLQSLLDGSLDSARILTGYPGIDRLTGGIHPGQLVLVAGRPGLGKSVTALDIARHVAFGQRKPVLFHTLEMSRREIGYRLLASLANVNLSKFANPSLLTEDDFTRMREAQAMIDGAPFYLDDSPERTTADIRARAAHLARQPSGLALIVVDYIGLLKHANESRIESQQVKIQQFSRDLKLLAKTVAPVLAMAQLNRGLESRANRTPVLSDLRDSGALEQDSDIVILLHQDADTEDANDPRAGEISLIVAKNRNGEKGAVTLAQQYHYARFVPME